MLVYLVPVGAARYELYCEQPAELPSPDAASGGIVRRTLYRFRATIAEAERERHAPPSSGDAPRSLAARVKARVLRYVAESIAEQRLLWSLRGCAEATLVHPADLSDAHAREILRRQLNRDFERHRFWLAIDSLGLIASAALALLPGPNLVAYYFLFRIVGHFLCVRGARQGMVTCAWTLQSNAGLSELRALAGAQPAERSERVRAVASELGLEHFAAFFEKSASES